MCVYVYMCIYVCAYANVFVGFQFRILKFKN